MNIKNLIMVTAIALMSIGVTACQEKGPAEKAGEEIDNAAENLGDNIEDATDEAGDKLEEAGDKVEDATD
jgi:hyperosmotically inducible protein